jgi:hypothetical protein
VELADLKNMWNQVLFALEARNRGAWLTFFDARLASLDSGILKLDFSDAEKFSGNHSYLDSRTKFSPMLIEVIKEITGESVVINW